jgi:hypothetical protein
MFERCGLFRITEILVVFAQPFYLIFAQQLFGLLSHFLFLLSRFLFLLAQPMFVFPCFCL